MDKIKNIRKGKDILFRLNILTNELPVSLEGRDILIRLVGPFGKSKDHDFTSYDNTAEVYVSADEILSVGIHTIEVYENYGKIGQTVVDKKAVNIVAHTWEENDAAEEGLDFETVNLDICMEVMSSAGIYSKSIRHMEVHTQATYDALPSHSDDTLYIIKKEA